MNMKIRKLLPILAIACGFFTPLSADVTQNSDQMIHRSSSDEMHFREITPNAGPRVTNGIDVFITGDFIYWTARQDGLGYARSGVSDFDTALTFGNASPGGTITPNFKFSPGFKAGIGLNLGHDGWDTYLNYTWLHSGHSSSVSTSNTDSAGYIPLWLPASIGSPNEHSFFILNTFVNVGKASGRWALSFNNFDLDLGRNFYLSQYLTFRPHIGLKGSWYTQNYTVNYSNYLEPDIANTVHSAKLHIKQTFWGIGVRTGLDASWYFDKNWSIFGDTSLSGLWGRFNTHRQDFATQIGGSTLTVVNTNFNFHTVKPVIEFQLGLRYDYWFSDDEYHFGIEAAWEEQLWLNHNQFFDTLQGYGHHGDLILQGFTLDVRFDF